MSHRRRIGLSTTNSSLIFDKQPSTWSHSTLLEPLKDCTRWKMKKTMQKLENLKTIRRRWSQLEVKLVTEKLKNEGTGSIRLNIASLRSFFFSPFIIAAFSAFHRSKEEKRQVLTNEEKHFLWRHSLLDPTSLTEVHIAFCHPLRHQFIGQHFLVNRISS